MKHVKLFESYTDVNTDNMSPEDFEMEVEKIIKMDPEEGARMMNSIIMDKDPVIFHKGLKKYAEWTRTLSDEQKEIVRKAIADEKRKTNPDYKSRFEVDAEYKAREKAKQDERDRLNAEQRAFAAEERKKNDQRNALLKAELMSKRSNILDKFAAGEITKEEALDML